MVIYQRCEDFWSGIFGGGGDISDEIILGARPRVAAAIVCEFGEFGGDVHRRGRSVAGNGVCAAIGTEARVGAPRDSCDSTWTGVNWGLKNCVIGRSSLILI